MSRPCEDEDPVEITDVTCTRETEKALLCVIEQEDVWIPKSQVTDDSEVYAKGHAGTLVVTAWIAKQKGLTA